MLGAVTKMFAGVNNYLGLLNPVWGCQHMFGAVHKSCAPPGAGLFGPELVDYLCVFFMAGPVKKCLG